MADQEPVTSARIGGFLTVDSEESDLLGLNSRPHGLLLLIEADGTEWTKVTSDLDYFALYVHAAITSNGEPVPLNGEKFVINLRGWPDPEIGSIPDAPDRDQ